ncbi:hypothetical protein BC835DRAFT_1339149 [Cytidiella melzeri]|nr:hypothetical protein BC835DRAFT_1339149 [Cytidiella melzeri]
MAPPPIQLFLTTIASQITLRQRQEYILRVLQVKKIPFTSYDLASDEDAKKLWRRKAPRDKQQLPGILVGGEFPGTFEQFEESVEFNELDIFLRRNEDYKPFEDDAPLLRAEPVGVPGAYSPLQMYPKHAGPPSRSPSPSPLAHRAKEKKDGEVKAEALTEFGLGDVTVSMDDLKALVEELGLGGEEARELVSGLAGTSQEEKKKEQPVLVKKGKDGEVKKDEESVVQPEQIEETQAGNSPETQTDDAKPLGEEPAPSIVKVTPPEEEESTTQEES